VGDTHHIDIADVTNATSRPEAAWLTVALPHSRDGPRVPTTTPHCDSIPAYRKLVAMAFPQVSPHAGRSETLAATAQRTSSLTLFVALTWLAAGGWRSRPTWPWPAELAMIWGVPMLIAVWFWLKSLRIGNLPKPAVFAISTNATGAAFVAGPASTYLAAFSCFQVGLGLFLTGVDLRAAARDPSTPTLAMFAGPIVLIVIPTLSWFVALFRNSVRTELRASGLVVREPFSHVAIPWESMGDQLIPLPGRGETTKIRIKQPQLAQGRGLARRHPRRIKLPHQLIDVHPDYLVAAINHYLQHPEHRSQIGTASENERLRQAIGGGHA
jgi:hypothetical protein